MPPPNRKQQSHQNSHTVKEKSGNSKALVSAYPALLLFLSRKKKGLNPSARQLAAHGKHPGK